ncbi:hypothetical protein [Arthrobacter sp. B0490]|uniref:hypothetical protein n=1 Tax=Arthrobacter sp. B0490 TaxID=2058891 RepID=UPI000CE3DEE5|nr:hypothetical protein [Arthrobacter sp. B0490]
MTDRKFSATEKSTSKHPQDWGRAMAVAICRLADMAREAGDPVHHEALIGEDLRLFVEDSEHGVDITMSWTPRDQGTPLPATNGSTTGHGRGGAGAPGHGAADQPFDPTAGNTAGNTVAFGQ